MLKKILSLEGAQELSRNEQKTIHGGKTCSQGGSCPTGSKCVSDCKYDEVCKPASYVECF